MHQTIKKLVEKIVFFPVRVLRYLCSHSITMVYRLILGSVANSVKINCGVHINNCSNVFIKNNSLIDVGVSISSESNEGYLRIGSNTQINRNVFIDFSGGVDIGDGVTISESAMVYTHSHGLDPRSHPTFSPLSIGDNVWIGVRVVVMPTCNFIAQNVVIGACSVVTKDITQPGVYAGSPARFLRHL
ncbi:hypothetical protein EV673_3167 [Limnobacter thiooxidans]|uniref:Acyltransferase n=1 Tax=Limnobacter thiooxidans TaxID=131080 RepID=A0AA86JI85_9BURK|nr:acyltransferase [Limnobacter sp.]MCZ8017054.1 acyltransferase [Limnobacter sp.]RZS38774.1 hypothetical protein EV673_3167 [Limnobacter thiooxidans]BET24772.1 acyltransferase [Limnobacter thiooxidans]